jgi:hypothetical protein
MSSDGGGSVGFCDTTMNRIDTSVSYTADCSGVGGLGRTLPPCHARVPIPVRMGGVGEMKPVTAMIADSLFDLWTAARAATTLAQRRIFHAFSCYRSL